MPEPWEAPGMQSGAWTDLPDNGPWCFLSTHWAPGTGKHFGFCVLFCSLFFLQGLWPFEAFLYLVYICQEIQLVKVFLNLCFIKIQRWQKSMDSTVLYFSNGFGWWPDENHNTLWMLTYFLFLSCCFLACVLKNEVLIFPPHDYFVDHPLEIVGTTSSP